MEQVNPELQDEDENLSEEEEIEKNDGVAEINEMLRKEREQFGSNDIELAIENIEEVDDNDNESDIAEKEFTKLSIHNGKFVHILNKLFLVLISYGFLLLVTVLFSGIFGHNVFPFQTQDLSHWATQTGYVIFFASYWTSNMILLRVMTIVGYIFFTTSAFLGDTTPYMDVLAWTYIFCMINIQQIITLLYERRPIVFDPYREKIYKSMFDGIMKRSDFKTLTKNSLLRDLDNNRFYAKTGDRCSSLSILVYGRMRVYKSNELIDENDPVDVDLYDNASSQYEVYINEDEFIDSSQWMLRNNTKNKNKGKRFTYSIKAQGDCKYLTWPREILQELLENNPHLEQPLLGALGLDVSNKVLLQSNT